VCLDLSNEIGRTNLAKQLKQLLFCGTDSTERYCNKLRDTLAPQGAGITQAKVSGLSVTCCSLDRCYSVQFVAGLLAADQQRLSEIEVAQYWNGFVLTSEEQHEYAEEVNTKVQNCTDEVQLQRWYIFAKDTYFAPEEWTKIEGGRERRDKHKTPQMPRAGNY
jgi:hypothetical protein